MSDHEDIKIDRVVHRARTVLATRFGLDFLARQYELAAKSEVEDEDSAYARHVAEELRAKFSSKLSRGPDAVRFGRTFAIAA